MKYFIISILLSLVLQQSNAQAFLYLAYKKDASGINCMDGAAAVTMEGGFPPYSYVWSGPQGFSSTLPAIDHLRYGEYKVIMTDKLCGVAEMIVNIGIKDLAYVESKTNPGQCSEWDCSGKIKIAVTEPSTFKWSGPGINANNSTNQNQTGLCKGIYKVTVTSAMSCATPKELTVQLCCCQIGENPNMPLPGSCYNPYNLPLVPIGIDVVTAKNPSLISQGALSDGAIKVNVNGGLKYGYTYSWVGPNGFKAGTANISELTSGTYTLSVTDGCNTATKTVVLTSNCTFKINAVSTVETCPGGRSGSIQVTGMTNGNGPFNIAWSNGSTSGSIANQTGSPTIQRLPVGNYTVTVTNSQNCTVIFNKEVMETKYPTDNPLFHLTIDADDQCFNSFLIKSDISIACPNSAYLPSNFPVGHVEHGTHTVIWPDMSTTVVAWSAEHENQMAGGWDVTCDFYGKTTFDVEEPGSYQVKAIDNNGCLERLTDKCFSFGEEINTVRPYTEVKPYNTKSITSCVNCSSCGGYCNGKDNFDCSNSPTKLKFTANNPYDPCTGGGTVSGCGGNIATIPEYVIGVPFILNIENPVVHTDGVCEYAVGCYFEEGTLDDPFFDMQAAYLETVMLVEDENCKVSNEIALAVAECIGNQTSDNLTYPYHKTRIEQGTDCIERVWCDEISDNGTVLNSWLVYSTPPVVDICYKDNGYGNCNRITRCKYTGEVLSVKLNVICDNAKLCEQVRPETATKKTVGNNAARDKMPQKESRNYKVGNREMEEEALFSDIKSRNNIVIFPNPYQNSFTIQVWSEKERHASIIIVDMLGNTKYSRPVDMSQGTNEIGVKLQGLQDGLYCVQLVENGRILNSTKVLQQN